MGAPPISLMGDELLDALDARTEPPPGYEARHAVPAQSSAPEKTG